MGVLAALLAAGGQVEAAAAQRWLRTVDCERALLGGLETRSAVPVLSSSSDEETMTKKKQGEEALSQMGFEQVDRNRWRLRSPALPTPESESERTQGGTKRCAESLQQAAVSVDLDCKRHRGEDVDTECWRGSTESLYDAEGTSCSPQFVGVVWNEETTFWETVPPPSLRWIEAAGRDESSC